MYHNNWEVMTSERCLLGEGPVWDNNAGRILWIDILKGAIHYYYPSGDIKKVCRLNQLVAAIALKKSGGLVGALKSSFAAIDLENGTTEKMADVESHLSFNRFNDGKCDPAGRFWAGSMSVNNTPSSGSLYVLGKGHTVYKRISGVSCSNGLAWNADASLFYYIDTPTKNVVAYDFDLTTGQISNQRIVISIPDKEGYPDGMTIDKDGMLWVAMWNGWKIVRYNPDTGKQLGEITLPVAQVTSCTFGGNTMQDIYITSASVGLSATELKEQPLAGALFRIKNSGFTGMEAFEFDQ